MPDQTAADRAAINVVTNELEYLRTRMCRMNGRNSDWHRHRHQATALLAWLRTNHPGHHALELRHGWPDSWSVEAAVARHAAAS